MVESALHPRTGFFHDNELIPIYENFCVAFHLIRQNKVAEVQEGRRLLERLFAFQAPDGNFPLYLHDYPRCFQSVMALRIAPILYHLLQIKGAEFFPSMEGASFAVFSNTRIKKPLSRRFGSAVIWP